MARGQSPGRGRFRLADSPQRGRNGHGRGIARTVRADVREALTGLGYGPDEIRRALLDLPDEGDPARLLRQALQRLAVAR